MDRYFQKTQLLTGKAGLEKLKASRVTVLGLGGVGSHAAEALCRCGVGHITIVDPDRVEESNINRQLPALSSTLGQYKTEVMAARMLQINPDLTLNYFTCPYNEENSSIITGGNCDYLIDAIDSFQDKIHLIKTCLNQDIPIISSMGTANRINPLLLKIADIKDTSICPVARRIRRELRKQGIYSGLKVVYSQELPLLKGRELGSMIYVTATAGLLLAAHTVNSLMGWQDRTEL
ncbi:MAG: tRNA threonylcarbamoyladenosine dehydratase [Syntrophomonadaceae bacterium]|jgi:tRNA A37 threonylcarbamoyladenosine dehydratase|nr:tRNA threonylcarbamoyladenosine dehydratase [Syntrophomonadaceae bacterium]